MNDFLKKLPKPDPNKTKGMGALFRPDDPRDYHLELIPGIPEALAAGVPASYMTIQVADMPFIYDQNGYGACVAYSCCGAKSIEDFYDVKKWNNYDAYQLYTACGGTGPNGIFADDALDYMKNTGCLEPTTNSRWRISSYAFAPRYANEWRQTLAAALVASGPCVVAMLIPSQFGWDSNSVMTTGYHQMCLVGYEGLGDDDYAVFLNSWGNWWANKGFCRVKWGYLEGLNFQGKHVYGYKLIDATDYIPEPDPDPTPIPIPDPNSTPVIMKVKFKRGKKLVVIGDKLHPDALLIVDGQQHDPRYNEGILVLRPLTLAPGTHNVIVVNPGGAQSQPRSFEVG